MTDATWAATARPIDRAASIETMPDAELKRRYEEIRATKNDYRFAELFAEAMQRRRTLEEIGTVIELGTSHVARLVEFSRFIRTILDNSPMGENPETARFLLLRTTERRFRKYHAETKAIPNWVQRCREIYKRLDELQLSESSVKGKYEDLAKQIKTDDLANGKEIGLEKLCENLNAETPFVREFLDTIHDRPAYGLTADWRRKRTAVRILEWGKERINRKKLQAELRPYLAELKGFGKLHPARLVPDRIRELAELIERVIADAQR